MVFGGAIEFFGSRHHLQTQMGLAPKGLSRYQLRCGGFLLPSRFCGIVLWSNLGFAFVTRWFALIRSGDEVYDDVVALWSYRVSILSWIGRWIGVWFLIYSGCLPLPDFQYAVIGGSRLLIALTFMVDFVVIWDVWLNIIDAAAMIREPIYNDGRFHRFEFWLERAVGSWIYLCWRLVLSLCTGIVFYWICRLFGSKGQVLLPVVWQGVARSWIAYVLADDSYAGLASPFTICYMELLVHVGACLCLPSCACMIACCGPEMVDWSQQTVGASGFANYRVAGRVHYTKLDPLGIHRLL